MLGLTGTAVPVGSTDVVEFLKGYGPELACWLGAIGKPEEAWLSVSADVVLFVEGVVN